MVYFNIGKLIAFSETYICCIIELSQQMKG